MARNPKKSGSAKMGMIQPSYLVDQVLAALQTALKSQVYRPGDKLPSEAKLAAEFGVGRSTIREALRVLSHLGLVETRSGKGTYVVHTQTPELLVNSTLELVDIEDIYDFRYALEIDAAERAALQRTDKELHAIKTLLQRTKKALMQGDIDKTVTEDTDFHIAILEAGHCKFAASIYRANRARIEKAARAIIGMTEAGASERSLIAVQAIHDDLMDALEHQDARAAMVAVRRDQREVHSFLRMQSNRHDSNLRAEGAKVGGN